MLTKPQPYEAVTPEAEIKTHEAEARFFGLERGRGQVDEAAEV